MLISGYVLQSNKPPDAKSGLNSIDMVEREGKKIRCFQLLKRIIIIKCKCLEHCQHIHFKTIFVGYVSRKFKFGHNLNQNLYSRVVHTNHLMLKTTIFTQFN